ncbi:matrixin family metalloprotease [Lactobacillus helsingborgensis]|uniref:matrixin family metalloprotease n=1 Tax=Lactobacillus helsingborgensis TaxID=1218494 RepID=UPI00165037E8|nr:matrixin family metalloprotease [Lactobacillus helsingborgensis]MBC6357435.1 matrixin family metalloprotease [Lactobacillus helsingborgensis]
MEIKLNRKFIKLCIAALALITTTGTLSPTTINNVTSVSAKAKKHHKKVKKTYVIAKYYDEFKPGYSYTYNKKKGVFIGHKMKKRHSSTTDSDEPKVEQATSTYDVPKVKQFTKNIENEYNIYDERWAKTTITYHIEQVNNEQKQIIEEAIVQINNINIIKLEETNKRPDITISILRKNGTRLGQSIIETSGDHYKNLDLLESAKVELFNDTITEYANGNYALELNQVVLHEIGHSLGLNHNNNDKIKIMYPVAYIDQMTKLDSTHVAIDQDYIDGLAILYQN